jgi:hypothetical protein
VIIAIGRGPPNPRAKNKQDCRHAKDESQAPEHSPAIGTGNPLLHGWYCREIGNRAPIAGSIFDFPKLAVIAPYDPERDADQIDALFLGEDNEATAGRGDNPANPVLDHQLKRRDGGDRSTRPPAARWLRSFVQSAS